MTTEFTTEFVPCVCGRTPELVTRDVEPQNDYWHSGKVETFVRCECGLCLFDKYFHEGFTVEFDEETRKMLSGEQSAVRRWNTLMQRKG